MRRALAHSGSTVRGRTDERGDAVKESVAFGITRSLLQRSGGGLTSVRDVVVFA